MKYRKNEELLLVFDAVLGRYAAVVKTKEEMAKYTFKKALKYIKQKAKKEIKKDVTQSPPNYHTRNFNDVTEKIEDDMDFQGFSQAMLNRPSPHNIDVKTEVIFEAFSFEDFYQGFQEYFERMESALEMDNNKKIDRFVKFIEGLMKKNAIMDVKKYKRIPWLKIWIEKAKKVTCELIQANKQSRSEQDRKIVKKEEYISKLEEGFDSSSTAKIEESSI